MNTQRNSYKEITKQTYNKIAKKVGITYDDYFIACVKPEAEFFLSILSPKCLILDIGCGVGTHMKYFFELGYSVEGIDISEEMVEICRDQGLNAKLADIETEDLKATYYDGIWAHTSLIHLPKKLWKVTLEKIVKSVKVGGSIFIAVREGSAEGFEIYKDDEELKRWFSNFTVGEIEKYLPINVELVRQNTTTFHDRSFINIHLRKTGI